ncbi:MAG: Hsp70 family protein [Deltaproteobacteria bacterium]|nr:Hsp70 family protein [Deltaproteobacteria bacterium]
MAKAVGIDFGTTYSLVAHLDHGRPEVISDVHGARLTPSVVAFQKDGGALVGSAARQRAFSSPKETIFSIKRRLGSRTYNRQGFSAEGISALILKKLMHDAEAYLGARVEKAVISVPAYFNILQRQAVVSAGRIAGIDVIRIIDEPTAAALAYGLEMDDIHKVLVWDLGGGTFDCSVLELGMGVFCVKSVNGDTHLGGDDYDDRIVAYIASAFKEETGLDLKGRALAMARVREAAEKAKTDLTYCESAKISLRLGEADGAMPQCWQTMLTIKEFEGLTADLAQRMIKPTEEALSDAGLCPSDIDRCILVGGSTRMPQVRRLFKQLMGKEPYMDIQPDEAVAMGAAVQAGILTGEIVGKVLIDVAPISLGIETEGGIFTKLIKKNTTIPTAMSRIFTNAADGQTSMSIHALQGERALSASNMTIGRFDLDGMQPLPKGEAVVEVSFEINANGILCISARDLYTDNSRGLRVSPRYYGLVGEEF